MKLLTLTVLLLALHFRSVSWGADGVGEQLSKELTKRTETGLALARFDPAIQLSLRLRYLDGRADILRLDCCSRITAETISRNRVVVIDLSSAPVPDIARAALDPTYSITLGRAFGGELVVMDTSGKVLKRSRARLNADAVSLSYDGANFAFVGVPLGELLPARGLYVVGFEDAGMRKLMSVPLVQHSGSNTITRTLLDWSPNGDKLLLSDNGVVWLVDAKTGRQPQRALDGGSALWSPKGDWISYVNAKLRPTLFNAATEESKLIDSAGEVVAPLYWSPDGKYLVLRELLGKPITGERFGVYRLTDGAFVSVPYRGILAHAEQWIQLK